MLAKFANGGAAVSVLAREAGARLVVVDAGVVAPPRPKPWGPPSRRGSRLRQHRPRPRDVALGRRAADRTGIALAEDLAADGLASSGSVTCGSRTPRPRAPSARCSSRPIRRMCAVRDGTMDRASSGRWGWFAPPSVRSTSARTTRFPIMWTCSRRSEGSVAFLTGVMLARLAAGPGAPGRLRHRRGGARRGRSRSGRDRIADRGDAITRAGSWVGPRAVGLDSPRPRAEAR